MKLFKIMYYRIRCLITMDHSTFTLYSYSLELKAAGKKYYYFKDIKNGKYVKVLKEENGEELVLYNNWLKDQEKQNMQKIRVKQLSEIKKKTIYSI